MNELAPGEVRWTDRKGRARGEFLDYAGNVCTIEESPKAGVLYLGVSEHRMLLTPELLNQLIPMLQSFIGGGKLR
jgi:hypothetical protein